VAGPTARRRSREPGPGAGGQAGVRRRAAGGVAGVPPRNPRFTGRGRHDRRTAPAAAGPARARWGAGAVRAGGVGKTQLALEYAHRFAADYDLVWWIDAEQPVLIPQQLTALAARLELPSGRRWPTRSSGCWPSCAAGTGGCWSSTTPSGPGHTPTTGPAGAGTR
jgi:hypothetical protein